MLLAALLALHVQPVAPNLPNRQPQLAAANGAVALAFGSGDSIWLARSTDDGKHVRRARQGRRAPQDCLLGRHRGPRVVDHRRTRCCVSAIAAGSDLFYWRSTDGGRTWSKPAAINDKPTPRAKGLHAMAADAEGTSPPPGSTTGCPAASGSGAPSRTTAAPPGRRTCMLYDGTICECCHPSLLSLGNGEFAVMWRNKLDGSRDFYVRRLRDGKPVGEAVKQGTGTWKLDACPMDGGGIALRNGEIVSAWRREHDIYLGAPGKPEVKLGPGMDVALAVECQGRVRRLDQRQGASTRCCPARTAPTRLSETGAFPAILALPDGAMLAAWEEDGSIATRRLE